MNLFFILSKSLQYFLDPIVYLFALAILGIVLIRMKRITRIFCSVLLLTVYLLSTKLVAHKLWQSLEHLVPPVGLEEHYDAAVVLGGIIDREYHHHRAMVFSERAERILEAMTLFRDKKIDYIVISSGAGSEVSAENTEAEILKKFAIEWGIPAEHILTDTRSRNTQQNAVESKLIIDKMGFKKILLITSAYHMKRGMGCFEKIGINPTPYPVDFTCDDVGLRLLDLIPGSENLARSSSAIHEMVGLIMYRVAGYTK